MKSVLTLPICFVLAMWICLTGTVLHAQNVPQGIQYQTVIYDNSGKVMANKNISLRFRITDASGSSVYWQEDQSATTNKYGLVSLVIGQGTKSGGSAGSFSAIDWSASKAKIEVLADVNGGSNYVSMGNNNLWSVPYALNAPAPSLNVEDLKNVSGSPANGDVLKWDGSKWMPAKDNIGSTGTINLKDLNDVSISSPASGQVLKWNGSAWVAQSDLKGADKLDDLSDVDAASPTNGYVLKWNGTQWVPQADSKGADKMDDLTDVNSAAATNGQVLKWNGSAWVPQADDKGATKIGELSDVKITTATKGQVLKFDGTNWAPAQDDSTGGSGSGSGSVWSVSGKNIFYQGGFVGIHTNSPAYALHVMDTLSSTMTKGVNFQSKGNTSATTGDFSGLNSEITGTKANNIGVRGYSNGTSTGANYGVKGEASNGVLNLGVNGVAQSYNSSSSGFNVGVSGTADSASYVSRGLEAVAQSDNGFVNQGVFGMADASGTTTSGSNATGVFGYATNHAGYNYGVQGQTDGEGVQNTGVLGYASGAGSSSINVGVFGAAANAGSNYAGYFSGNVTITGTLTKAAGTFKIDDPRDPANKYLIHSFVESPDMMNVYNGNITTGNDSVATIELPDYFQTLNKDYRYQLTVIGDFAQAIVYREVSDNHFVIKTSKPNVKVSWQVTGVRQDPYAKAHPIIPEVEKTGAEKGKYLNPELYGQPQEKALYPVPADARQMQPSNKAKH